MDTLQPRLVVQLPHPAIMLLVAEVVIIAAILSAPVHTSFTVRLAALVPLLGCLYGIVLTASHTLPMALGGLVCGTAAFSCCHYLDVALIRWPLLSESDNPKRSTSANKASLIRRLRRGIWALSSFRKANTSFEVKNVPRFRDNLPPNYSAFLRSSATSAIACMLVLDLASLADPPPPNTPSPFSAEKVPLLLPLLRGTITAEDVAARCIGCLSHWLLTYCLLRGCYDACSFALVAAGLTPPDPWRPLFGPAVHMSTLRGFWGSTWHQLIRDPCGQPAAFLTYHALGLPKSNANVVSRYVKLFLTFTLSGLVHMAADVAAGIPFQASGVLGFFLMQVVGILLEDTLRAIWGDVGGTTVSRPRRPRYVVMGYVWVAFWLFWTTPMWFYPSARYHDGTPLLPFSVIGFLVKVR